MGRQRLSIVAQKHDKENRRRDRRRLKEQKRIERREKRRHAGTNDQLPASVAEVER